MLLPRQLRNCPGSTTGHFDPDLEREEKGMFSCIASSLSHFLKISAWHSITVGCRGPHAAFVWHAVKGRFEHLYFGILTASPSHPSTPSTQSVPARAETFLLIFVLTGSCRCLFCLADILSFFSHQLQNILTTHIPRFASILRFPGPEMVYANLESIPTFRGEKWLFNLDNTICLWVETGKCRSSMANVYW